MPVKVITKKQSSTCVENVTGVGFVGYSPQPDPGTLETTKAIYNGNYVALSASSDSVNTPGYNRKKVVRVTWVPRKNLMSPPRLPRFPKLPALPIIRPRPLVRMTRKLPTMKDRSHFKTQSGYDTALKRFLTTRESIRRYNQEGHMKWLHTDSHWLKITSSLKRKIEKVMRIRKEAIAKYDKAVKKYHILKARYDHQQELLREGKLIAKRVKDRIQNPNNPYSRSKVTLSMLDGWWDYTLYKRRVAAYTYQIANDITPYFEKHAFNGDLGLAFGINVANYHGLTSDPAVTAATSSADSRARLKLYTKLSGQEVHIGNVLAERHQTLTLIADIARRIASMTPKKLFANALSFLNVFKSKQLANDYLALMFGVKPLLNDVYGMAETLAKASLDDSSSKIVIRAISEGTCSFNKLNQSANPQIYSLDMQATAEVKVSYVLEYRIVNGPLNSLQSLGLINPAEIAWEAMPWSFVVDWFLPIGKYINSLSSDAGLEFVTGTKTVTTRITSNVSMKPKVGFNSTGWRSLGSAKSIKVNETKVRTVLSTAPCRPLPQFKSPYSFSHILLSLALLRQRL